MKYTFVTAVAEKHADLAVFDAAGRTAVLTLDTGRMLALLHKTRLIYNQYRLRTAQLFDRVATT